MQSGSVTLIFVLCLMGGVIAYCADLLGRRLGKKRLTLGHMRPKHTAALLTTSAGVLIPIVTISLMSLLFADVRDMLFRTEAIKEELRNVEGNLRISQKNLDRRANEIAELELAQRKLVKEGANLRETNDKTSKQLGKTRLELGSTQKQLASRSAQLRILSAKTRSLSGRVSTLLAEVNKNIAQLKVVQEKANTAQKSATANQALANQAARTLREIQQRNIQVEQENLQLTKKRQELEQDVAAQKALVAQLDEQLKTQVEKAKADLAQLEREQAGLLGRIEALNNMLEQQFGVSRTQPMIFAAGQEIARWIIDPNSSRADAALGLNSLLRTSRVRAEAKGAKATANAESAGLFNGELTADQQINLILREVTAQSEPMVLIASSIINQFAGEPVYVQIAVEPNTIVYKQGEVISETRIDGSLDERRILAAISEFISTKVGPKALEDKMIPVVGSDAPLGEVDDNQIVSLMQLIKDYGRPVRVQALAAGETRRADRLRLEFRLR